MIDLHCHLLPDVDDGAESLADSIDMARGLATLGFQSVCCTPHVPYAMFTRSPQEVDALRAELQSALQAEGLALRLLPGGEHHASDVLELLAEGQMLLYPGNSSFLLEFSLRGFPPRVDEMFFRFQLKRLTPVLAHVERYPEVQLDVKALGPLRERGCLFLINLSSLANRWDRSSQAAARAVLAAGWVDAVTSDLHGPEGLEAVSEGLAELARLVSPEELRRLTSGCPATLLGCEPPAGE